MTLRNKLVELEKRAAQANQSPFVVRFLNEGQDFEAEFGHSQGPNEFLVLFVAPKVWPDDPGFDATKPLPDE